MTQHRNRQDEIAVTVIPNGYRYGPVVHHFPSLVSDLKMDPMIDLVLIVVVALVSIGFAVFLGSSRKKR